MVKKAIDSYLLRLFFYALLIVSFPAVAQEQQEQTEPPALTASSTSNRTQALSSAPPSKQESKSQLEIIATISAAAIHAAEHSVEVMLGVIAVASFVLTVGGVLAGVLGIKAVRAQILDETRKKLENELQAEVNKELRKWGVMLGATTYVAKALMLLQQAELAKDDRGKKKCLGDGVFCLERVAEYAEKSDDVQQLAWSYAMRAYMYKRLDDLDAAINAAERAIQVAVDFIEKNKATPRDVTSADEQIARELEGTLANRYYNLAAYCCLKHRKNGWIQNLEKAVKLDPELEARAPKDDDFKIVWEDEDFKRLTT